MPLLAAFAVAAPEMLAIEAAAATAAEIAAAEAAAAAAAEAAATTAAQQAAATTAAEAAATTAAQQAATTAAQQGAQAGITQIGGTTANAPLTSEAVNAAAQQANAGIQGLPQGFDQQLQNIQNMSQGPSVQVASTNPAAGIQSLPQAGNQLPMGIDMPGAYSPPSSYPMGMEGQIPANQFIEPGSGGISSIENTMAQANAGAVEPPSPLMKGLNSATEWASKNKFQAATGAYMGANALGLFKPSGAKFDDKEYDGPLSKYRLSDDFQAGSANPQDFQYTPRRYAAGGIMNTAPVQAMSDQNNSLGYQQAMAATGGQISNFAKGGSLSDSITQYQKMLDGKAQAAPARSADVGIYYDQDPDTRYQDALTAAQIRQAKVNQRAYVSPPAAKRPTPMGQLQMASVKPRKQSGGDDVEAARGGIMHSSLGGYAAGGNPRLLKGPGDGMSDNIPATINGRQPARLADGEFVIPADVVSHLGNGSTEAGAKQLHAMMDKVRSARTGNKKQGKQIKPQKYMPK